MPSPLDPPDTEKFSRIEPSLSTVIHIAITLVKNIAVNATHKPVIVYSESFPILRLTSKWTHAIYRVVVPRLVLPLRADKRGQSVYIFSVHI